MSIMQTVEISDARRAEIEAELDRDMRHGESVQVGDVTIWLCGNVTLPLRDMAGQEQIPCYRCGWGEWQYSTRVEKAAGWKLHCLYCDTPRDPDDLYRFAPNQPNESMSRAELVAAIEAELDRADWGHGKQPLVQACRCLLTMYQPEPEMGWGEIEPTPRMALKSALEALR